MTDKYCSAKFKTGEELDAALEKALMADSCCARAEAAAARAEAVAPVTPQMFGAKADGVTDDTNAVQAALDCGGEIYFPAGRYKVTQQLIVDKPCCIRMFKPYPAHTWPEHPLTDDDNWMGARIETYSTDGGMWLGDAVEVDGLFLRAMLGFKGVLLKFDNSIGEYCYPSSVKLCRIKLEIDSCWTIPESMFDFTPDGSHNYILDDITIGRSPDYGYAVYGFRTDLSKTTRKWANNVRIYNLCIDMRVDYPLYIDGASCCAGWLFNGLTIQGYAYNPNTSANVEKREGHIDLVTLKNVEDIVFLNGYLWDLTQANYQRVFATKNIKNVTCIGCNGEFDAIESTLSAKMKAPENLNIANLEMSCVGNDAIGANILTLSDGEREQSVAIPAAVISEEQIGAGVSGWMDENAAPKEVVGRNKLDIYSPDCRLGYEYGDPANTYWDEDSRLWTSNFIDIKVGDVVRISNNSAQSKANALLVYDETKTKLGGIDIAPGSNDLNLNNLDWMAVKLLPTVLGYSGSKTYDFTKAKYCRIVFLNVYNGVYADRETSKTCVTINDNDISYTPYETHLEGGIGSFIILQAPNGTRYSISVNDDGTLYAKPE